MFQKGKRETRQSKQEDSQKSMSPQKTMPELTKMSSQKKKMTNTKGKLVIIKKSSETEKNLSNNIDNNL